jgi:hypothetical protein
VVLILIFNRRFLLFLVVVVQQQLPLQQLKLTTRKIYSTVSSNNDNNNNKKRQVVMEGILFFLTVAAVVVLMAAVAYILSLLFDKYGSALTRNEDIALSQEEFTERQIAGTLMKRSGLAGLLPEERARVIRHFFTQRTVKYKVGVLCSNPNPKEEILDGHDVKQVRREEEERIYTKEGSLPVPESSISITDSPTNDLESQMKDAITPKDLLVTEDIENHELQELCDKEHTEGTCPICISEYGKNGSWCYSSYVSDTTCIVVHVTR